MFRRLCAYLAMVIALASAGHGEPSSPATDREPPIEPLAVAPRALLGVVIRFAAPAATAARRSAARFPAPTTKQRLAGSSRRTPAAGHLLLLGLQISPE
jgi:hypothetical protein